MQSLFSDDQLNKKYLPRKNTKKPENVEEKFELNTLTKKPDGIGYKASVQWATPIKLYPNNKNIGLYFDTPYLKNFDLAAFGYLQKKYLQDTWLLSVVCSLCQEQSAKEWLKKVFITYDASIENATLLEYRLKNPILDPAEQVWEKILVKNELRLCDETDDDVLIGVNWNFTSETKAGPFWFQYFEMAFANMIGSYGDLHGASLDRFRVFEALVDEAEVEACEVLDPESSEKINNFLQRLSDTGKTSSPMVARFRKEKMRTVHPKGSKFEILGVYEQYCTILRWEAYETKPLPLNFIPPKWVLKIRDFYQDNKQFFFSLQKAKAFYFMNDKQKTDLGFKLETAEAITFMFEDDFVDWFDKIWVCTDEDWVLV